MWFVGSYSIKKLSQLRIGRLQRLQLKKKKILAYPSSVFPLKLGTILNEFNIISKLRASSFRFYKTRKDEPFKCEDTSVGMAFKIAFLSTVLLISHIGERSLFFMLFLS